VHVFVALLILFIILAQLPITKSYCLFNRNLWIDEIVTYVLANDPKTSHALKALIFGLDTNPPAYHIMLRLLRFFIGNIGEVTLRAISLLAIWLALVGLYALLSPV
jgi:hypothetical protein